MNVCSTLALLPLISLVSVGDGVWGAFVLPSVSISIHYPWQSHSGVPSSSVTQSIRAELHQNSQGTGWFSLSALGPLSCQQPREEEGKGVKALDL